MTYTYQTSVGNAGWNVWAVVPVSGVDERSKRRVDEKERIEKPRVDVPVPHTRKEIAAAVEVLVLGGLRRRVRLPRSGRQRQGLRGSDQCVEHR